MAVFANSTLAPADAADESLTNALWFIRNHRFLMALETLRSALAFCQDERRSRIAGLVTALEGASVASLMGA